MVWNLMECRRFEVHSYCRASRAPIGAMFPWSPKGTCPSMFLLRKTAALGKNFQCIKKGKIFQTYKRYIAYCVTLKLGFLEYFFFFFSAPSLFDDFLLSVLHCCLMDDDLEFFLVNLTELTMLVHERKNGFLKF